MSSAKGNPKKRSSQDTKECRHKWVRLIGKVEKKDVPTLLFTCLKCGELKIGTHTIRMSHSRMDMGNSRIMNLGAPVDNSDAARLADSSDIYGDGSDGAVTISTDTVLTGNKKYSTLTVNAAKNLDTDGYLVQVSGTCTVNGTIHCNGNDGVGAASGAGAAGGAGRTAHTFGGSAAGGAGGTATGDGTTVEDSPGVAGSAASPSLGGSGGAGANGGNASENTGGAGGTATKIAVGRGPVKAVPTLTQHDGTQILGGAGGGGGGGATAGNQEGGGGGGGGGGICVLLAATLVNNGVISANGGNGGGASGPGTGAGGGGGGGGYLLVITDALSGAGTRTASGGVGGTSERTGTVGSAGVVETLSI